MADLLAVALAVSKGGLWVDGKVVKRAYLLVVLWVVRMVVGLVDVKVVSLAV